eukprot:12773907-Prorocentrum_lima.AAC.1
MIRTNSRDQAASLTDMLASQHALRDDEHDASTAVQTAAQPETQPQPNTTKRENPQHNMTPVSYTHLRAHETRRHL